MSSGPELPSGTVDRKLDEAVALQGESAAATLASQVAEKAVLALVPLDNPRNIDLVSERLGNYQHNPQFGFLLDQAWVK